MVRNNVTGGVFISKNNLLLDSILGLMGTFFLLSARKAQDRIPICPPLGKTLEVTKPLRKMNWADDTIAVQTPSPSTLRETERNEIIDSITLLALVFEHLRQVRAELFEDTVRILCIGDGHVRGHIYPQTTGALLKETFGAVSYIDTGMGGVICLTFAHPGCIADIAAMKPELLILSFGANESHSRRYNVSLHYSQMDKPVKLLRDSLPNVPTLLTTPPGPYENLRQRRRKHTYAINPRTVIAVETIRRYAKGHHLFVQDMYDVVGGERHACTSWMEAKLMRPDHVHYLPEGYVLQGNLLYQAIVQVYNSYASH